MRPYPHEIDEDFLEAHYAAKKSHYLSRRGQTAMARAKGDVYFFTSRQTEARQLAAMSLALEAPPKKIRPWLADASDNAREAFRLQAEQPPFVFMTWLALAILVEHDDFREQLQDVEGLHSRADEIFVHTAHGMRHLAAERIDDARAAAEAGLARARTDDIDRDAREVMEPLLLLLRAILERNDDALAEAIAANDEEFRRNFDEDISIDADGLLNVIGLGILQLAREHGLEPRAESPYLPVELLRE